MNIHKLNMTSIHPSNSEIQRQIEIKIVQILSQKENCDFIKEVEINHIKYEFDFFNNDRKIIGEIYAGIDNLSAGSRKKIIADCFKLIYAEKIIGYKCQKILVFIDENIKRKFEGKSWIAHAIKEYDIKIILENIDADDMNKLRQTRAKQQKGNVKKD